MYYQLKEAKEEAIKLAENSRYGMSLVLKIDDHYEIIAGIHKCYSILNSKEHIIIYEIDGGWEYVREGGIEVVYKNPTTIKKL